MESLIFAFSAISPIVLMVVLGYILKRVGLISKDMIKPMNKLVFRIFLPVLLFLNVYRIESISYVSFGYMIYAAVCTLAIFFVSLVAVFFITPKAERRGVLLQACFRSNHALIGVALAQALAGDEGVCAASLLSALIIPLYNVLAVFSLSIFQKDSKRIDFKKIAKDIVKNPLIQGIGIALVLLGIRAALISVGITFRLSQISPLMSTLNYLSSMATPLALLVLGAQFEFSSVSSLKKEILFGTAMRTLFVPAVTLGIALLFFKDTFTTAQFAVLVSLFATPVAVSSVPMTQEMGGDSELAGQIVIWTTLLSAFTVFFAIALFRMAGIFA